MVYILILAAVILRLLPHVPNFAPIAALALFGGVYLKDKRLAIVLPLGAMLASDLFIGLYSWKIMASVYLSFALVGLIGLWLKNHKKLATVVGCSLLASSLFYLITNFSVWAFGTLYPRTLSGLIACYIAAIPFFRNTLLGDLFYVGVLFGSYELAHWLVTEKLKAPAQVKS